MACLIKAPRGECKGVVTFTTGERDDLIFRHKDLQSAVEKLRQRFAVGMHHNWHDFNFRYNPLFDFHMAGEEDLIPADGNPVPLIPMDACNFSPPFFAPTQTEKFWDILFIARAVKFKGIPEFFKAIRRLYDQGHALRVLFLCPMPPPGPHAQTDARKIYDDMFTKREQQTFVFLTLDFNYPFPFDLETLGHFYRSSRIFVHSAPDERRCRVAAYAWATGLPVVGKDCIGSILSKPLRRDPYFFRIDDYEEFPAAILAALEAARGQPDFAAARDEVAVERSIHVLNGHLKSLFAERSWLPPQEESAATNLDLRLGRHHGLAFGGNLIPQDIGRFMDVLSSLSDEEYEEVMTLPDPEIALATRFPAPPRRQVDRNRFAPRAISFAKRKLLGK